MLKVLHTPNSLYYEAILQLRPVSEKVLDFVLKKINARKDVFISKTVELKTGINLYLSSKKFAMALGKMLKKSFKADIKLSRSLFSISKKTGKRLWRVTVCARFKKDL